FLRGVFMDPKMDPANKQLMIDGAKQLQALCMRETGQRFDGRLGHLQKERLLRQFEQDELGGRFLGKMLEYLIEGLLGSPIYGGNRGEVGWQWLNHSPGYPLPPADKKYYEL
ncbi:MAG TPA: hypothetical protein DD979_06115, partial [Gammaproteobacteria bacterium]|nr:hypothetical protein [Gammaproteobacteria bacterium]